MSTNHSGPRAGTIVWAIVLLVFAAVAFSFAVLDVRALPAFSLVWIVTGLGVLLVVAAIVALVAGAARRDSAPAVVESDAPVEPVEPVATPAKKASTSSARKKDQPVD